jgi:hypothetical protein
MTEREICKKIIKQKDCCGVPCIVCPHAEFCRKGITSNKTIVIQSTKWLDEHPEFQKGEKLEAINGI